jgi:arylsulfatase A-like enzyme
VNPNVILIVADDLGYMDLSIMGSTYYETPNIDRLAKEGMLFTNAYASAANCAPSRACMISGLHTPRHGVYTVSPSDRGHKSTRKLVPTTNTRYLKDDVHTLPKMMKSAGYVTGSFGKWHVGENPSLQGFDVNVGGSGRGNPGANGYFSPYKIDFIENHEDGEYLTDRLTDEAISFLDNNQDTSFFLYLPFYTVHTPIIGKPELIKKFESKKGTDGQDNAEYAAMVASLDENIGRLFEKLKQIKQEENTLIIFTSDNGGLLSVSSQEPLRAGKGSYYEGGIRVPMIVKWPNYIKPGSTSNTRITNMDFYPTLQEIVNPSEKAALLDGTSLRPLLLGKELKHPPLFFHFPIYLQSTGAIKGLSDPLFRTRPGSVIIDGDWKLHHYYEDNRKELYNLRIDVSEANNVIESFPEIADSLFQQLNNWRIIYDAPIPIEKNQDYDAAEEDKKIKEKIGKAKT